MDKIKYSCKACDWEKELPLSWKAVVPKHCGNHKCEYSAVKSKGKKGFMTSPEMLQVEEVRWAVTQPVKAPKVEDKKLKVKKK